MIKNIAIAAIAAAAFGTAATAAVPVYPNIGTANPAVYTVNSFVAQQDQDLVAYYLGFVTAAYRGELLVAVNGVNRAPTLPTSAAPGTSVNFGAISAGDTIEFILDLTSPVNVSMNMFSSTTADNADGLTHIYTTSYGGGDFGIALGNYTYVGFEDILGLRDVNFENDFDYNDHRFAFNLRSAIPEPATWTMLIAGFGLVGFAARRRKPVTSVTA